MEENSSEKYDGARDDFYRILTGFAKICSSNQNADLLKEMVATVIKLGGEIEDRGDLKLISV